MVSNKKMAKVEDLDSPVALAQKLQDQPEAAVPNDIQTDDLCHSEDNNKQLKTKVSIKTMAKVPDSDSPVVPQKLQAQPEAAIPNEEINKHLKNEVSIKTMAKVPDLVSPVVPQKLPDQPEAPVPNDIQTDDLHYSEENNKHFKTPDAKYEQSEDVWIEETLDMKGPIYVPPAFESYCNKKFVTSRCWNNLAVKDIGPEELGVSSLKGHLEELFPFPSSQRSSEERLKIYQESTHGVSHSSNCVRAFLSLAFPPIVVCKNAAYEFTSLTFINDVRNTTVHCCMLLFT